MAVGPQCCSSKFERTVEHQLQSAVHKYKYPLIFPLACGMTQLMTNYWVRNSSLDLCIIVKSGTAEDGEEEGVERKRNYFVRGLINIPTLASASSVAKGEKSEAEGEDEGLTWGVWVRVNEETFKWIVTNWDKEGRESDERAKGTITAPLPTLTTTQ